MQIKSRKNIFFYFCFFLLINFDLFAEEFNITAKEIIVQKDENILIGKGSVTAVDLQGNIVKADKITYKKKQEFLLAEGNVIVFDNIGNVLKSNKATYDKINEIIVSYSNTVLVLKEGLELKSNNITYDLIGKILSSSGTSTFEDEDGNNIETSMFQYSTKNNLFSSIGEIKIIDIKNNKYFFKELYIDTKKNEMIGSDVSVLLDQENFGLNKQSDPRFVANDILVSKNKTILSKGVFTSCKIRDNKCPPWELKAKKISHDKIKKTIYYDNAILKVYNFPIFYFPKFFHPDPSVKRQSGFLAPFFTNSTSVGAGFALPYYSAISNDRDLTFTPKIYTEENILLMNEYRQAFKNGFLTLDASFTEGYKNTSETKTSGSRNHVFADLKLKNKKNDLFEGNLSLKVQRTSNDTYLRVHDINTSLVKSENTNLENELKYTLSSDSMYLDVSTNAYENLREKENSDKFEYILPNIIFGKTFLTEQFGAFDFKSNALYSNYETNKHKKFLTNDIIWNPPSLINKIGFVSRFQGMLRNTNYETEKTSEYKDDKTVNEIAGVVSYKTSLPLKKNGINYTNLFSPNFMIRYAPGHMRNLSKKDVVLNYTNLYSLNKTAEVEDGFSAILGFDFKMNEKLENNGEKERFSLSLGQVVNIEENKDIPSKSSLDQKTSDVVGEFNYNFSEIGKIGYKFSVDHNMNDLNYNEISTELDFGKIQFNIDYLEEQNHIGSENYVTTGVGINLSDNSKLSLSTKKNFKRDSTELYDLNYQYTIDCLKAGLSYRREFYEDSDLGQNNSLMFTITFIPFTSVNTPALKP